VSLFTACKGELAPMGLPPRSPQKSITLNVPGRRNAVAKSATGRGDLLRFARKRSSTRYQVTDCRYTEPSLRYRTPILSACNRKGTKQRCAYRL
jgi:hypothetical protein